MTHSRKKETNELYSAERLRDTRTTTDQGGQLNWGRAGHRTSPYPAQDLRRKGLAHRPATHQPPASQHVCPYM